jgi:DNA-directed RNA polymerase subunit RPC12/RpoP
MTDVVTFICPECGKSMRLTPKHLGRAARCAHCGEAITTPTETEVAALHGLHEPIDSADETNSGESDAIQSFEDRLDRMLTPPYLFMGILFPMIIAWYCGWFGVVRQDIWFGGVAYGGDPYGGTIVGPAATVMGIGGLVVALGFHLNSCWAILHGKNLFNRLGNLLVVAGLMVFLGSLLVPAD